MVAALVVVAGAVIWAHGRYAASPSARVPISAIVQDRARWLGMRVRVSGGLPRFSDPRSGVYGVVDDAGACIGLRHLDGWTALVGRLVVAVGTVQFDPRFGLPTGPGLSYTRRPARIRRQSGSRPLTGSGARR
jgi:hypothetical protein